MNFNSIGILKYEIDESVGKKVIVLVDREISNYYKKLLPKWYIIKPQKYKAHISVVRSEKQITNLSNWNKYNDEIIEFSYSNEIIWDNRYYWLQVECERLKEIRVSLGLSPTVPWTNKFHITIGNLKD